MAAGYTACVPLAGDFGRQERKRCLLLNLLGSIAPTPALSRPRFRAWVDWKSTGRIRPAQVRGSE